MKKLVILAACGMLAAVTHAAAVGWNIAAGDTAYGGYAYQFYVIGQNGASSIATITSLLSDGTDTSSYVFGAGTLNASGVASVTSSASGKTLGSGTYEAFAVIFDSATPTAGSSNYAVVSGAANLTKTIADSTAAVTFMTGSSKTILADASNWKSYGAVPEPTSGLLMLLGMAGLALRRKRA